ncbi:hypothetical protein BH20VER1_BH20VER1_18780 [soil metagenome]
MKVLVLTTDLPFFPGKNGHDFFNLRFLAQRHAVGVVGPLHAFFPEEGLRNLEAAVSSVYFWPRPAAPVTLPPQKSLKGRLAPWLKRWKARRRERLLWRLLDLQDAPPDAYLQLAVLSNCAPNLLAALTERAWQAVVLIQSNTVPWLDYLPAHLAKVIYFHDVRSDLTARQKVIESGGDTAAVAAVWRQERRACQDVEVAGFVSQLDRERAEALLEPRCATAVSPIPVDTDYYVPRPAKWVREARPIVLFTGHLSHPPNVDAVMHFLESVWPQVRQSVPDAVFQVAGLQPHQRLIEACARAGVELHPDVPDIRPFFWNARAYVVPMRFGGGVRQKIFEAWLMEVPVVCTTMAAEGTRAVHGRNCWIEDMPLPMATRVASLLRGDAPADLVANAATTARTHNSIPVAAAAFEQLMTRAVAIKRERPYKLLFDLRWMEIGKAGGVEQLAYEQLDTIGRLDHHNAYRVLCPRSTYTEWKFPNEFHCRGFYTDDLEARGEALHAAVTNRLAKTLRQPPLLTGPMRALRRYRRLDFDLVHSVNSYIHPDLAGFPHVLTMCDLQHLHLPEFFTPAELEERDRLYRSAAQHARHVICISEHTRQDLREQYGVPLEKSSAIWIIPSRAAWMQLPAARAARLLGGMRVKPGRFLFYPAQRWGHKNHARLIAALALAVNELPPDLQLVLTGRPFPQGHPALAAIAQHGLERRVVQLGYRSPMEIRALYGAAFALVFPSLFEGFGMPVAEAMITGCPVACSNTTSLPEIAGDAAITFDPTSINDMARAITRLVGDATLRQELIAAGARRRPLFSARRQAIKTLAVYRRVYDEFYAG